MQTLHPLWWAAWVFDADALVSWTADSNVGAGRSNWAPHAGQAPLRFEQILVPATRGLSARECEVLAPSFDLRTATPVVSIPPQDVAAFERFDLQRSAARREIVHAIERIAAQRVQRDQIPGTSFRKVRCAVLLQGLFTRRVALPTYVLAYQYEGKLYRAVVHGQDARRVHGSAPLSWARVMAVVLLGLLVVGAGLALAALSSR